MLNRPDARADMPMPAVGSHPTGRCRVRSTRERLCWSLASLLAAALIAMLPATASAQFSSRFEDSRLPAYQGTLQLEVDRWSTPIRRPSVEGQVWSMKPVRTRVLVPIPLSFEPGQREYRVGTDLLDVGAGRLVAWRLSDPKSAPGWLEKAGLREDSPITVREFFILPDGRVRWEIESRIPNASVRQTSVSMYRFLADRQLLESLAPGDPPSPVPPRGVNPAAHRAQYQVALRAHRARVEAYNEARRNLSTLPKELTAPQPDAIWAIIELPENWERLEIVGEKIEPLPWRVEIATLESVVGRTEPVALDKPSGGSIPVLPPELSGEVAAMLSLLGDRPHPFNVDLVARALAESRLVWYSRTGDALYQLVNETLRHADRRQANRILALLLELAPPTAAGNFLIGQHRDKLGSELQLGQLSNALQTALKSPDRENEAVFMANEMLADPNGPPPGKVLDLVIETASQSESFTLAIRTGIQLDEMPADRLERVQFQIVESAPTNPIAAAWLDQRLLGSNDPTVVRKALNLIRAAETGSAELRPYVSGTLGLIFGPKPASEADRLRPTLASLLPIDSTAHSLFQILLNGERDELRRLAWQTLPYFALGESFYDADTPDLAAERERRRRDAYNLLINAALDEPTTPGALVDFLDRQRDPLLSTEAMVRLVLEADPATSARASRTMLGSDRPIGRVLAQLPPEQRYAFAIRTYANLTRSRPYVAGLLLNTGTRLDASTWFGSELAEGRVPRASDWREAGAVDRFLELAVSSDRDLALAASSALVSSLGGDDRAAVELQQRFAALSDQRLQNLRTTWYDERRGLFLRQLRLAPGPYEMVIDLPAERRGDSKSITFDVGRLLVQGDDVLLDGAALGVTVPPDALVLQLTEPEQLMEVDAEAFQRFNLASIQGEANLRLQGDGVFVGRILLPGLRQITLSLRPLATTPDPRDGAA